MLYDKEKRGSVTVYFDKEICIKGEYLKIATISEGGTIKWYVDTITLPKDVVEEVTNEAKVIQERFQRAFNRLPEKEQARRAMSICPAWLYIKLYEEDYTEEERLRVLKDFYFSRV